jgi:hypothetical protein
VYVGAEFLYRVFQEECSVLYENVSWVKLHAYKETYVYEKLNGYGDNNSRKMWSSFGSTNLISYLKTPQVSIRTEILLLIFSGSVVNTGWVSSDRTLHFIHLEKQGGLLAI